MDSSLVKLILMRDCIKKQIDFFEILKGDFYNINKNFFLFNSEQQHIVNTFNKENNTELIICKIDSLNQLLIKINKEINNNCVHCYCEDYIDVNENTSKPIKYCEKCWTTF
uniref:Uncharacterized protein n=1 Tax=viral metagenome TaxID=1070528 RepID=A0A6C0KTL1_9ZZZZ